MKDLVKEGRKLQKQIILGLSSNMERLKYLQVHEMIMRQGQNLPAVDKGLALELLEWIRVNKAEELPELKGLKDWSDLPWDDITDDFIRRLRKVAEELGRA